MNRQWCVVSMLLACFLWNGSVTARQDDVRLPALFDNLLNSATTEEARAVETNIWGIWTDSGRDDVNRLMTLGIEAMSYRRFKEALKWFDEVVSLDPEFAEGWNKRATVYWLMDEFGASMEDIQRTLILEPRHFGAISGMGLIFLGRGDQTGALAAFEEVLKINPRSRSAQLHVEYLRNLSV